MVGVFQRTEPAHDVGRLADDQPKIRRLERDLFEVQQRTRLCLVAGHDVGTQFERGQGDSHLHTSLHRQEFEVHVDRISQLWRAFSYRAELDRLACVWTVVTNWTSCGIDHWADHTGPGLSTEAQTRRDPRPGA